MRAKKTAHSMQPVALDEHYCYGCTCDERTHRCKHDKEGE